MAKDESGSRLEIDDEPMVSVGDRGVENCVRDLVADCEQLGIGNEDREVSGADAVDLLNHHLPLLRAALAEPGA